MIRDILSYPDERLAIQSEPVEHFDDEIAVLIEDMTETMLAKKGIGLAAPQVDVRKRVIVIARSIIEALENDTYAEEDHTVETLVLVNPQLELAGEHIMYEEGCLSVPQYRDLVPRRSIVHVTAQDIQGNPYALTAEGLLAICIQHECDHLEGKLFIDRLSFLKRSMYDKKLQKK